MNLHLLSGGAAQGVVDRLRPAFESAHGCQLQGTFGAVGVMRDKLLAGADCDVLILSAALIDQLEADGHVAAGSARPIGAVSTGIAVRTGTLHPDVSDADALKALFSQATGLYVPDMEKSTAGIHVARVLERLGLTDTMRERIRAYPNGNAAMAALAACDEPGLVGCTQETEILFTQGVERVASLPSGCELDTLYVAAMAQQARQPALAQAFIAFLTQPEHETARREAGFHA